MKLKCGTVIINSKIVRSKVTKLQFRLAAREYGLGDQKLNFNVHSEDMSIHGNCRTLLLNFSPSSNCYLLIETGIELKCGTVIIKSKIVRSKVTKLQFRLEGKGVPVSMSIQGI